MNNEIKSAIARSISHTEIVRVTVADKAAQIEALEDVGRLEEVAESDYVRENDDSIDVWGTTEDGKEFRLRIVATLLILAIPSRFRVALYSSEVM